MRRHVLAAACGALLAIAGCTRGSTAPSSPIQPRGGGDQWSVGADGVRAQDRLLIRRASLDVELRDPGQFAERARTLTERLGGFVAHSSRTGNGDPDDGQVQLVLRIPSARSRSPRSRSPRGPRSGAGRSACCWAASFA